MDETTPGISENIPPAQKPFTIANATSGGIEVAKGQIASAEIETNPKQRMSELREPNRASAKIPNPIRPAAEARLYLNIGRYVNQDWNREGKKRKDIPCEEVR